MHIKTKDALALVDTVVAEQIYRANSQDGAPTERDLRYTSLKEEPHLSAYIQKVAAQIRGEQGMVKSTELIKQTSHRVKQAIRAVAGKKGTIDAVFLSKAEIERVQDDDVRGIVKTVVELRKELHNWYNKDPENGGVEGVGIDRAYVEGLASKDGRDVVVAVIDSGVDINHEDLQGKIWTNTGEIPDGKDTDGNGYVDDIHGWNFLGSVDEDGNPVNLNPVPMAVTRELASLKKTAEERELTPEESAKLDEYQKEVDSLRERYEKWAAAGKGRKVPSHYWDENYSLRDEIIGDDIDDLDDRFYGNNDVQGPEARHGTHVAATIAQNRGNGIGFDGVAENVKIMPIRAIPDGDEYDKDVANAIRYAVDNGADIINMSFGKSVSRHPGAVTEALQYAFEHGVIVVHAAGNSGENNDEVEHYPRPPEDVGLWLDVGASSAKEGPELPAVFSNYGKESVDLFAPGVRIEAALPGDKYGALNGTSMATPVVAAVLAVMRSTRPDVEPERVVEILQETVRTYPDLKVWMPRRKIKKRVPVEFSSLSKTGGIVDAMAALRKLQREAASSVG